MKLKLLFTLLVFFIGFSVSYASFPVKRNAVTNVKTELSTNEVGNKDYYSPAATVAQKDKWVGAALWLFLGWPFAAHRWYYNKPVGWNILFILTIGGLGVWAIIDLINILTDKF